jgi:hypothetical protein
MYFEGITWLWSSTTYSLYGAPASATGQHGRRGGGGSRGGTPVPLRFALVNPEAAAGPAVSLRGGVTHLDR